MQTAGGTKHNLTSQYVSLEWCNNFTDYGKSLEDYSDPLPPQRRGILY
jgi:hypothetical protein